MPMLGVTTGWAATPSQSHETDMLRSTLTKVMFFPKWSTVPLEDSAMRSISSSSAMSQWLNLPVRVWICALPIRASAQPMPIFLLEPPKPPITCPLKWVRTKRES